MLHGAFTQGTTPTQVFELPFEVARLNNYTITYSQNNEVILKKHPADCRQENNYIFVTLTQQETLFFSPDYVAEIQLKVHTTDGKVLASPPYRVGVMEILDKEVFG